MNAQDYEAAAARIAELEAELARYAAKPEQPPPDDLSEDEYAALLRYVHHRVTEKKTLTRKLLTSDEYGNPRLTRAALNEVEDCLDWHRDRRTTRRDWLRTVQSWLRNIEQINPHWPAKRAPRGRNDPREMPQEPRGLAQASMGFIRGDDCADVIDFSTRGKK